MMLPDEKADRILQYARWLGMVVVACWLAGVLVAFAESAAVGLVLLGAGSTILSFILWQVYDNLRSYGEWRAEVREYVEVERRRQARQAAANRPESPLA